MASTSTLVQVDTWPEDFQQLLANLLDQYYHGLVFDAVVVSSGMICDHFKEWEKCVHSYWDQDDYDKVTRYCEAIQRGDRFPPLIARRCKWQLQDGYHRLAAYRTSGLEQVDFIYIDEQEDQLVRPNRTLEVLPL